MPSQLVHPGQPQADSPSYTTQMVNRWSPIHVQKNQCFPPGKLHVNHYIDNSWYMKSTSYKQRGYKDLLFVCYVIVLDLSGFPWAQVPCFSAYIPIYAFLLPHILAFPPDVTWFLISSKQRIQIYWYQQIQIWQQTHLTNKKINEINKIISIYLLSDLDVSSNLIGSLYQSNYQHYSLSKKSLCVIQTNQNGQAEESLLILICFSLAYNSIFVWLMWDKWVCKQAYE